MASVFLWAGYPCNEEEEQEEEWTWSRGLWWTERVWEYTPMWDDRSVKSLRSSCMGAYPQRLSPERGTVERFRGGLVLKAHRLLHHSTLGSRVIMKKEASSAPACPLQTTHGPSWGIQSQSRNPNPEPWRRWGRGSRRRRAATPQSVCDPSVNFWR